MSQDFVIAVRNVSKKFSMVRSPLKRMLQALPFRRHEPAAEFWALRDITWTVPRGATVGVVGRNGSGKSTLLQLICSILQPTHGSVSVQGRVSALLELGAGFNPEYTGRANVVLDGVMKGLSQREAKKRVPQIEAFAEIGKFIDQPVKKYSSGMFVRLAFAAAISVEPDILIVDEALAVGDARFQHKCYEKFLELQRSGKTILFVTHDSQAVVKHCQHAILLEGGRLLAGGEPKSVTDRYRELLSGGANPHRSDAASNGQQAHDNGASETDGDSRPPLERFLADSPSSDRCPARRSYCKNEHRFGDRRGEIVDYLVVSGENQDVSSVASGDVVDVYLKIRFHRPVEAPIIGYGIKAVDGLIIYGTNTPMQEIQLAAGKADEVRIFRFSLRMVLPAGDWFVTLALADQPGAQDFPVDNRLDLIHLQVYNAPAFTGLINLEAGLEEIPPAPRILSSERSGPVERLAAAG